MSIRIGIMGYGNLGRGVESAILQNPDLVLSAVFSRRSPENVHLITPDVPVYLSESAEQHKDEIDVLVICGGSATDLPLQTPHFAQWFNVVDSFDNHAHIPEHFSAVDTACRAAGTVGIISVGWDPGLFSLARVYAEAALPCGAAYTFWGKGVSQGHSDAIRRIKGVADARQYTVPVAEAMEAVRSGGQPDLTARQKHTRECYVVLQDGADASRVEREIKEMPNYFADYDTTVHFISAQEMAQNHAELPHGGSVMRSGRTGKELCHRQMIEYSLRLDSNPEFTGSVLTAFARAAYRLSQKGETGCRTVMDIAPALLSGKSDEELRASLV